MPVELVRFRAVGSLAFSHLVGQILGSYPYLVLKSGNLAAPRESVAALQFAMANWDAPTAPAGNINFDVPDEGGVILAKHHQPCLGSLVESATDDIFRFCSALTGNRFHVRPAEGGVEWTAVPHDAAPEEQQWEKAQAAPNAREAALTALDALVGHL